MFDPFKKLKLASAFLGVDSPAVTPENLDIAELFGRLSLKDLRGMTLQPDKLLEQPGVRALHESRYMPSHDPLDKLTDLGEGTLGFEYARYLRHHKLPQPQLPQNLDLGDANTYLSQRVRMTHPILHVVTEYDASPLGELALQAYYVGQLDNLISGVIISSVLLQITRDSPELLGPALEVTAEAYQRGKAARTFLGIAWEELWSAQVPQLRELIEIPSRTSAVAHLRFETSAPASSARRSSTSNTATSSSSTSAGGFGDGFAAFSRSSQPSPAATSSPSSSSSSSSSNRGFSGFGSSAPAPAPAKPAPPERPTRPPEPPSKLLASFMALAEQEAAQPAKPEPPPPPPPARTEARPPSKPPPPPPAKTPAPEPGYQVEETAKNITPALSPDDPDYF